MVVLRIERSHGDREWWCRWWEWLRVPHRFHVPEQRVERSHGPYMAGGGIVTLSTCSVGLVSMETTGLMPLDLLTSLPQLNGMGI